MADNITLNAGSGGDTCAADDVGGFKFQRVKPAIGADGTATDAVPVSNGMDVTGAAVLATGMVAQFDDTATGAVTENQFAPVRISSRRALLVEGVASGTVLPVSDGGGSLTVDGTVTINAIPAGTANIGDVDVLTVNGVAPAFGTGVRGATVQRVTVSTDDVIPASQSGTWTVQPGNTANTTAWKVDGSAVTQPVSMATQQPVGTVAHDGVDSGNPVKVGARAVSSLASATMVAAADRADNVSDLDGAQVVRLNFPLGDLKSERIADTAGTSVASSVFTAVASTKNVVTSIAVYNSSATPGYIDFRDGTAGSILWTMPLPAGGGAVLSDPTGMFRTSANTALAYDVSGALATVYVSVSGFQSKV